MAILARLIDSGLTKSIFVAADQIVTDIYIVFIAISIGAFVPNFGLVIIGSICIFMLSIGLVYFKVFHGISIEQHIALLIVTLGFTSISNLYRQYRENGN